MVGLPSWMRTKDEEPEKVVSYLKNEGEAIASLEAARTKVENVKAILSDQ